MSRAPAFSLAAHELLPFSITCAHCGDRRYDEPNRRHITARVGDRTVCADLVVNDLTSDASDTDTFLDTASRRLLEAAAPDLLAVAYSAPCQTQAGDRFSRRCDEVRAMEGAFERPRCPRCAAIAKAEGRS